MLSTKEEVRVLASLMLEKGITDVVISPGSRNAPLINTFDSHPAFRCFNVVDERSAAFFAMGLALKNNRPVAVCCTSGSALLNYAPAAAEALYQKIPLLILSADRPKEWVDQGDGQTIRQENALANVVKKSISLTGGMRDETEQWHNTRLLNEGLNALVYPESGPVHINLPFAEPLYDLVDEALPKVKNVSVLGTKSILSDDELGRLKEQWTSSTRTMILVGQMQPNDALQKLLNTLSVQANVVVLTEKTSNICGDRILSSIDNLLSVSEDEDLAPDLLITLGRQIVSKKIKTCLRSNKPQAHWHFSPSAEVQDTFMSLTELLVAHPEDVLSQMIGLCCEDSSYAKQWLAFANNSDESNLQYLNSQTYCDFTVLGSLFQTLPDGVTLHLSNSTPVRYAQLFPMRNIVYQSNRGTSGIDGVISTAGGYAHDDTALNILVVGDLSFFYDSNAMWNKHFPSNLKIILINNEGGGIFRFIPGPSSMEAAEEHFVAEHQTKAEGLVKGFGLDYLSASSQAEFEAQLAVILKSDSASVLEVFTPAEKNAAVLRDYFTFLKRNK